MRRVSWLRLWCRGWGRSNSSTRDIANHGVCGGWMTIVPLRFNERMVYQQGRALLVLSFAGIASECPSVHSSEQIAGLWISDCEFRHDQRDRSVSVKAASR